MRQVRIFNPGEYHLNQVVDLSPAASRHIGLVLRMAPGQIVYLFSGNNHEYEALILDSGRKKVRVQITAANAVSRESPRAIHLAQALSKGERMEFVVQKAVELGITSITPLLTEHSVVKLSHERMEKKQAQWQAIAIAACEQSGRNVIPAIDPPCSLQAYCQQSSAGLKFVLAPNASQSWRDYTFPPGDIALLIGPEGGLSNAEISLAKAHQFKPLTLGPRVLRTETAAITALSVLQAVSGDL